MPQDTSASDDDLDFLDDLLETSSKSNEAEEDDIALPDFDYIEGKTEVSSSPKGEMDEGYVEDSDDIAMPDFDYIEGKTEVSSSPKGEMDEQLSEEVVSQGDKVLSEDEKNSMLADMDSILTETDEKPSKEIESVETETIKPEISAETEIIEPTEVAGWTSLGFLKLSKTLVSQHLYLSIVYTILVFTTFEVVNPNMNPIQLDPTDFIISPVAFLGGWLLLFVMGWYFGYTLRKNKIPGKFRYLLIYFITQVIVVFLISIILLLTINPSYLSGDLIATNYLMTSYYLFIPTHYLIILFTGGWFTFILGYRLIWDRIYKLSPMYQLEPSLIEIK